MAISAGAAGAWAASNATTQTVTLPAHAAGDLLLLIAAAKAGAITNVNPRVSTPPDTWKRLSDFADGTTIAGSGTGSVNQAVLYRIAASSAETNPVVTWGTTSAPGIAVALGFTKASGETWYVPAIVSAATNAATSISVAMGSNPGITAGDWGIVVHTTRDDSALTVPTWTATGATLGTAVVYPATAIATATSNQMAGTVAYRPVTSGTASAAPVVTGTQAAAETGVTSFVRLRVATTPAGTTIYPTTTASAVSTASDDLEAWTSRGSLAATWGTTAVTGPTAPIQMVGAGGVSDWFTRPLAAFTLSGAVFVNARLYTSSSNGLTKVSVICEIARVASDGTSPSVWATADLGEPTSGQTAIPGVISAAGMAVSDGERLRIRFYIDDLTGTAMVASGNVVVAYDGPTPGATGDTYLTFSQTLTEYSAVAERVPYATPYPQILPQ